ncbi:MAG: amidohydrolase family protein [Clostridia bacterium]|jgi:5-methylthioadenosine/S-adenosylhomocysteine deaminase
MNILIRNAEIYTMDPENTHFTVGSLCIEDDTISYVGPKEGVPGDFHPDRIIEGKDRLLIPGMVNGHTHLGMTLFRGYANGLPLWEWLSEKIWPLEDQIDGEDVYWASLLGIMELLAGGCTAFSDMYFFMDRVAEAVEEVGIRAVLARGLQGPDANSDLRLKENRELHRNWHNKAQGRIKVMAGPHAEYTCSPEFLIQAMELADELGTGIHIHVSETEREVEECRGRHGKSPVAFLADLGILDRHVTAAHCVVLDQEDLDILADKGVFVVHNPGSNLKLASGFAPVTEMKKKGITVCLGTDGAASNNNLNLWEEMSLAALIHKGVTKDATALPASEALRMATFAGAKALDWDGEIGSLEVGKKADLVMVNGNKPHYYPKTDMEAHLVYSGQASDVELVTVNGKVIYEKGEFLTIDRERVFYEIKRIAGRLYK